MTGKMFPFARIVEGTNSMQAACPECDYGKGYLETIFALPVNEPRLVRCKTCGLQFIAPVMRGNEDAEPNRASRVTRLLRRIAAVARCMWRRKS